MSTKGTHVFRGTPDVPCRELGCSGCSGGDLVLMVMRKYRAGAHCSQQAAGREASDAGSRVLPASRAPARLASLELCGQSPYPGESLGSAILGLECKFLWWSRVAQWREWCWGWGSVPGGTGPRGAGRKGGGSRQCMEVFTHNGTPPTSLPRTAAP